MHSEGRMDSELLFEPDHLLNQVKTNNENHLTSLILPNLLRYDLFEIITCHLGPHQAKMRS